MTLICSLLDVLCLQKPDSPQLQLPYKGKETQNSKPCLTYHNSSISHQIMPLVINSLGGQTHVNIQTSCTKAISRSQVHAGLWSAHIWFKNIYNSFSILKLNWLISLLSTLAITYFSFSCSTI